MDRLELRISIHLLNGDKQHSSNTVWVFETNYFMCACHLIDIRVLLAVLPFVLHNGFQMRETISDLEKKRKVKQLATSPRPL